jgi:hypothetical protein
LTCNIPPRSAATWSGRLPPNRRRSSRFSPAVPRSKYRGWAEEPQGAHLELSATPQTEGRRFMLSEETAGTQASRFGGAGGPSP